MHSMIEFNPDQFLSTSWDSNIHFILLCVYCGHTTEFSFVNFLDNKEGMLLWLLVLLHMLLSIWLEVGEDEYNCIRDDMTTDSLDGFICIEGGIDCIGGLFIGLIVSGGIDDNDNDDGTVVILPSNMDIPIVSSAVMCDWKVLWLRRLELDNFGMPIPALATGGNIISLLLELSSLVKHTTPDDDNDNSCCLGDNSRSKAWLVSNKDSSLVLSFCTVNDLIESICSGFNWVISLYFSILGRICGSTTSAIFRFARDCGFDEHMWESVITWASITNAGAWMLSSLSFEGSKDEFAWLSSLGHFLLVAGHLR